MNSNLLNAVILQTNLIKFDILNHPENVSDLKLETFARHVVMQNAIFHNEANTSLLELVAMTAEALSKDMISVGYSTPNHESTDYTKQILNELREQKQRDEEGFDTDAFSEFLESLDIIEEDE